jgi:nucleotidyltransferase/DNA polymerase involved in DNA repair
MVKGARADGRGGSMKPRGKKPARLTDLANIGKTTAAKLERIGIRTAEDFLKRDPYGVFEELRAKVDPTLCRCALAGIVGAKTGEPWHVITKRTAKEYEKRHPRHKWGPC